MPHLIEPETQRLQLRQWRRSDRRPFAALNADPQVMEHFPRPLSRIQSNELADRCARLITEQGWGFWAVEVTGGEPFIGFVGLHVPTADLPFNPCVEVGWRLAVNAWGHGYATEAAQAALTVAFTQLDLPEVVSFTAISNQRSQRVMERLGLSRAGEFEHPSVPEGNPLRAHVLYRIDRLEWQQKADADSCG